MRERERRREREREGKIHTRDEGFVRLGASERRKQSNVLEWSTGVDWAWTARRTGPRPAGGIHSSSLSLSLSFYPRNCLRSPGFRGRNRRRASYAAPTNRPSSRHSSRSPRCVLTFSTLSPPTIGEHRHTDRANTEQPLYNTTAPWLNCEEGCRWCRCLGDRELQLLLSITSIRWSTNSV